MITMYAIRYFDLNRDNKRYLNLHTDEWEAELNLQCLDQEKGGLIGGLLSVKGLNPQCEIPGWIEVIEVSVELTDKGNYAESKRVG